MKKTKKKTSTERKQAAAMKVEALTQTNTAERIHLRASMEGRVYIHDENNLFIAPLNNISAGGLFIDGLTSLPEGSDVKVVIKSAKLNQPIQAEGHIVRIEDGGRIGSAVQFTAISAASQVLIDDTVHRVSSIRVRHAA